MRQGEVDIVSDRSCRTHVLDGMYNDRVLVYEQYSVVDPCWAWNTVEVDIPNLEANVQKLLA